MLSEEGKYLEGEDRIKFLMGKIQEMRKLYMQLKSEVACIDRRRKRQRRKLHDGTYQSALCLGVVDVYICIKCASLTFHIIIYNHIMFSSASI